MKMIQKIPETPLREIMLDAHEVEVKSIYSISKNKKLHYNEESTQICVNGVPIFDCLADMLFDSGFVSEIAQLRTDRRRKIIDAHSKPQDYSPEDLFHLQFDYELLAIDHLVNTELVGRIASNLDSKIDRHYAQRYFLTSSSGRTFFEEVLLKEFESLGHQLLRLNGYCSEKDFFFEDKGFHCFLKHTMTRDKLIRIILDYDSVVSRLKERYDSLLEDNQQFESPSEVYDKIKEIRVEQMR